MKALLLLSGGIDSAVALWHALEKSWEMNCLTFDYHRRPPGEHRAMEALLQAAGDLPLRTVHLPFLKEVADLGADIQNPGLRGAPEGYIPARNLVFYALALNEGERIGARYIVGGHNGGDSEVFPDANPQFFGSLNALVTSSLWSSKANPMEIYIPLAGMSKVEVLRTGERMGVPFELTWSCYWDGERHCGQCESCRERRAAFAAAGMADPTSYGPRPGGEEVAPAARAQQWSRH